MNITRRIKEWLSLKSTSGESTIETASSGSSQKAQDSFSSWFEKVSEEKRRARDLDDLRRRDALREEEARRKRLEQYKLRCPDCGSTDIDSPYGKRFECRKCGRVFS